MAIRPAKPHLHHLTMASAKHLLSQGHITQQHHDRIKKKAQAGLGGTQSEIESVEQPNFGSLNAGGMAPPSAPMGPSSPGMLGSMGAPGGAQGGQEY